MDKWNVSSGFKLLCATVNRDVGVIESKTLDEITRNYYWNELKLLCTRQSSHTVTVLYVIVTTDRFVVVY